MQSFEKHAKEKCMKLKDEYENQCSKYQKFYSIIRPTIKVTNCEKLKAEYIGNMCNFYTGGLEDKMESEYEYFYGMTG